MVVNLLNKVSQIKSEQDKSLFRQQIDNWKNGSAEEKVVYADNKQRFDGILASWNSNNTDASQKTNKPDNKGILVALGLVAIGGVVVTGLLLIRRHQRAKKLQN